MKAIKLIELFNQVFHRVFDTYSNNKINTPTFFLNQDELILALPGNDKLKIDLGLSKNLKIENSPFDLLMFVFIYNYGTVEERRKLKELEKRKKYVNEILDLVKSTSTIIYKA